MQHHNLHHVHDLPDFGSCFPALQSFDFELPGEGYSRNVLCALNLISMFYYGLLSYLQNCASNDLCMFL